MNKPLKPLKEPEETTQPSSISLEVVCKDVSDEVTYPANRLYGDDKESSLIRVKNIIYCLSHKYKDNSKGSKSQQMNLPSMKNYAMPLGFTIPTSFYRHPTVVKEETASYTPNPNQKKATSRNLYFKKGDLK